ncbi:MAG: hypothetical protein V4506_19210 [Bacteroidota bacterium]
MRKRLLWIAIIVIVVIIFLYVYYSSGDAPQKPQKPLTQKTVDSLGYKQNNPGNIRNQGDIFDGEVYSNSSFKVFDRMANGYRAMAILLFNYFKRGENTLRKLITEYAPPNENTTSTYINFVSDETGIGPDKVLSLNDFKPGLFLSEPIIKKIVRAISQKEISWVNESELNLGYNEFLKDRI